MRHRPTMDDDLVAAAMTPRRMPGLARIQPASPVGGSRSARAHALADRTRAGIDVKVRYNSYTGVCGIPSAIVITPRHLANRAPI